MSAATSAQHQGLAFAPAQWPPRVGQWWPEQGGVFAGVLRARGDPLYDLCLVRGQLSPGASSWGALMDWAYGLRDHGFADWRLPNRREAALLVCNDFEARRTATWYWTRERNGSLYAWAQSFGYGEQDFFPTDTVPCHAMAVRLVPFPALSEPRT